MAQVADYNKAENLYRILIQKTSSEKPVIIRILRETGNHKAANIIEGVPSGVTSSTSNQDMTSSDSGQLNVPQGQKLKVSTFQISRKLNSEGGEVFQGENHLLVQILKSHPIRDDVSGLKFPGYCSWKRGFISGSFSSQELIQFILEQWVYLKVGFYFTGQLEIRLSFFKPSEVGPIPPEDLDPSPQWVWSSVGVVLSGCGPQWVWS